MKIVQLQNTTLEICRDYMHKTLGYLPLIERNVIFIVDNKKEIEKDIEILYNSLPIKVPFDFKLPPNVKIIRSIVQDGKEYKNYLNIEDFTGNMYFVEEKDIEIL
jgi:hypothetical protein